MTTKYRIVASPIGPLTVFGTRLALLGIHLPGAKSAVRLEPEGAPLPPPDGAVPDEGELDDVAHQLGEYFAGRRRTFDLPLAPHGTEFQRRVWAELARIPYGEVISYRTLAVRVGNPNAIRAVGGANGRNPLPIVIPCHRVIAADGSLAGFGGGVPSKQFLLALEGVTVPRAAEQMTLAAG